VVVFSYFRKQEEDRRALKALKKDVKERLSEAKEQALHAQEQAAKVLQEKEAMEVETQRLREGASKREKRSLGEGVSAKALGTHHTS
jgi:F0F1-type ATP synthase membrane subunit b/b'